MRIKERVVNRFNRWRVLRGSDTPLMTRVVMPGTVLVMIASVVMLWAQNGYHFGP